ncbi:MAG: hypothetical protein U0228_03675 [Myxococcaceae bacterium]
MKTPPLSAIIAPGALMTTLWLAPTERAFQVAWVGFTAWGALRAAQKGRPFNAAVVALAGAAALIPMLFDVPPTVVLIAALCAAGAFPFHLGTFALERGLLLAEFQLVLLGQPGLAWLHRYTTVHGPITGPTFGWMLGAFVCSAVLMTGLGLVRQRPSRAVTAILLSQSMLALAGALGGEAGWGAARALWASMALATIVLQGTVRRLALHYGATHLDQAWGLAETEPRLHKAFLTMGWLSIGVPGGIAFFAQDVLFHAVIEHSIAATMVFLVSAALNAIVFYRVYLSLFTGPPRFARVETPSSWRLDAIFLLCVVLVVLGGLWPASVL